jgi:hypothetical protein
VSAETAAAGRPGARRVGTLVAGLLFLALPLSTAAQEIAMAAALLLALALPTRGALGDAPWARPAVATALVWLGMASANGNLHEGAGHAWLLAPLLALPALAPDRATVTRVGLGAAAIAAGWAVVQRALGEVGHAGLSHHLSLAYALLPPLGVAVAERRLRIAVLLALGVLSTGSEGATVALAVTVAAAYGRRPAIALAIGAIATIGLLYAVDPEDLRQRAILWTGGLDVAAAGAVGPGGYAAASAPVYDRLSPGFYFPNHAHDSAVQALAVLGPMGLLVQVWLCVVALRRGAVGPAAGLAGVLVGSLSQDVFGDLEVARAAWAWLALSGTFGPAPDTETR